MGTVATMRLASLEEIYFSKMVPPPLPHRRRHAPTISEARHSDHVDFSGPCVRAIPNIIKPARKNRAPAIRNGGIDWIAKRMPRYVEPQIRYNAANAITTRNRFGAAILHEARFDWRSNHWVGNGIGPAGFEPATP